MEVGNLNMRDDICMIDVLYPYLCFDQNDPEVCADVDECIKIMKIPCFGK